MNLVTPNYFNPTVAGACEVLRILSETDFPISVSQIAARTNLTRGTALRVMRTLAEVGMAKNIGDAKYIAGSSLIGMGVQLNKNSALGRVVRPHLQRLTEATGETSHFAILAGDKSLVIEVFDCTNALRVASRPGAEVWIHAAATGKAILSVLPRDEQKAICQRLDYESLTPNTITSPRSLLQKIKTIETQGYAVDDEEYFIGVRCLAAPVTIGPNRLVDIGAIGITSATARFTKELIPKIARIVCGVSRSLTSEFQQEAAVPAGNK